MIDLVLAGLILVIAGLGVMAASMLAEGRKTGSEVKGGGVLLVGPIPIIFGSDARWASVAIALAIVLVVLVLLVSLV